MTLLGVTGLFISGCENKSDPPVVEEDLLPEDEHDLLEEPDLESVEDTALEDEIFESGTLDKTKATAKSSAGTGNFTSSGKYVVQISIFKSQRMANKLKDKLSDMGYPAYVAEVSDPIPELMGDYYRVRIGQFASITDAKSFGENVLIPQNYDFWVDLKSNDHTGNSFSSSESVYESTPVVEEEVAPEPMGESKKEEDGWDNDDGWNTVE
jgi:hypothetical protein